MFEILQNINKKPKPYQFYSALSLWTDEYRSEKMLEYHLNQDLDMASRNKKFIYQSVDWILSKTDKTQLKICDFGCGPGLYTLEFAKQGANVTGIDFSRNSIEYAKLNAKKSDLKISYINQDYLTFEMNDKFDLITMVMCDFCALSPIQRSGLLNKFKDLLNDDGIIILDVYSINSFNKKEEVSFYELNQLNSFWSQNDYYAFVNTFLYEKEKVSLDKYSVFEHGKDMYEIYNWLQYYNKDSLNKEFLENGLIIESFYSDIKGSCFNELSDEIAIVAKKNN